MAKVKSSGWESRLELFSREPAPRNSNPAFTMVLPKSGQVGTPGREFLLASPSEGVTFIGTVASLAGWDVEFVDLRTGTENVASAAKKAVRRGGVAAMPTFADSYPQNEEFFRLVKEADPGIVTVAGGTLVSSLTDVFMSNVMADYAVLREGELTLLELLEHIAGGGTTSGAGGIDGLAVRGRDGSIGKTRPRGQIADLDALPEPDLSLYPTARSDAKIPELGYTTSRGCYGRCTFCFVNIPQLRFKTMEKVERDLGAIKERHATEYLFLNDLTFTADPRRIRDIANVMGTLGLSWSCSTRVEGADPALLRHMRENGCRDVWYGVESLDQDVLDRCNKKQTVAQILDAIRITKDAGIEVMVNLIVGLPGESRKSLDAMIRFVETSDVIPCSIKYLTPFPGTPVFDEAIRNGVIGDPVEYLRRLARRQLTGMDDVVNMTDLPESELRHAFDHLVSIRDERLRSAQACT